MHQTQAVDVDGTVISVNGTVENLKPTWITHDLSSKKSIAEKCPCLVKGCENIPRTRLSEHILSDYVHHLPQSRFPDNVITLPIDYLWLKLS